jgi:hypothetical protein
MMDACQVIPTSIEGVFTNFYTLVIFLMIVIVGFLYMLSRIFKELAGVAKTELREIYISVFIGIFSLILATLVCQGLVGYVQSKYGSMAGNHFSIAENYLEILIYGKEGRLGAIDITTRIFADAFEMAALAKGFQVSVPAEKEPGKPIKSGGSGKYKLFASLEFFSTGVKFILNMIYAFTVVSLQIQRISLSAAQAFAFSLLLPIGLILRVIPITRNAGSFLIASAFGLYVIWPMLFVFEYDVTRQIVEMKKDEISKEIRVFYEGNPAVGVNDPNYVFNALKETLGAPRVVLFFKDIFTLPADLAMIIIPQSTILGVINFTILIAFVSQLDDFLKSL